MVVVSRKYRIWLILSQRQAFTFFHYKILFKGVGYTHIIELIFIILMVFIPSQLYIY